MEIKMSEENNKEVAGVELTVNGEAQTFSQEEVQQLVDQGNSKAAEADKIMNMVSKYDTDVDTFLANVDGSFSAVSNLISEGIIDEKGQIIKREPAVQPQRQPLTSLGETRPSTGNVQQGNQESVDDVVARALVGINSKLQEIDKTQTDIIRNNLQGEIKAKFPNLDDNDVSQVFGSAMSDKRKSLWEHAEGFSQAKVGNANKQELAFAKKYNIDIEKFNENKIFGEDPSGGATAIRGQNKMSFKRGEGKMTPMQATLELMNKVSSTRKES